MIIIKGVSVNATEQDENPIEWIDEETSSTNALVPDGYYEEIEQYLE